jgi:hypothetical protein
MIFAEFLLAEDGEFQRHLLTACGHLIVMALGNEDHRGKVEADRGNSR